MTARLEQLVESTRDRLERAKRERPLSELERRAAAVEPRPFSEALSRPGTSLVAEYKRRSPSAGAIREEANVGEVAGAYERGGAAALSILTEEEHFGGSLADLERARAAVDIPILRKDFHLDRYQLYEAKLAGADAVLLVVRALSLVELEALYAEARALELDALVEVHTDAELAVALEIDVDVIGINNRDLDDFSVDIRRTFDLLPDIPAGKTVVAESGIRSRRDVEALEQVGVDALLVGEALMRAPDPEAAVRELTGEEELGAQTGTAS